MNREYGAAFVERRRATARNGLLNTGADGGHGLVKDVCGLEFGVILSHLRSGRSTLYSKCARAMRPGLA